MFRIMMIRCANIKFVKLWSGQSFVQNRMYRILEFCYCSVHFHPKKTIRSETRIENKYALPPLCKEESISDYWKNYDTLGSVAESWAGSQHYKHISLGFHHKLKRDCLWIFGLSAGQEEEDSEEEEEGQVELMSFVSASVLSGFLLGGLTLLVWSGSLCSFVL